jgi:homoserine kinase
VVDDAKGVHHIAVPGAPLPAVALFVPDVPMSTTRARGVLAATVSRHDAVYNVSRTALLVAAAAAGRHDLFAIATGDALHQRARESILPSMGVVLEAARSAGAMGAWLSGAGSTMAAFARDAAHARAVANAMEHAARGAGSTGRTIVTTVASEGAHVQVLRPASTR